MRSAFTSDSFSETWLDLTDADAIYVRVRALDPRELPTVTESDGRVFSTKNERRSTALGFRRTRSMEKSRESTRR